MITKPEISAWIKRYEKSLIGEWTGVSPKQSQHWRVLYALPRVPRKVFHVSAMGCKSQERVTCRVDAQVHGRKLRRHECQNIERDHNLATA